MIRALILLAAIVFGAPAATAQTLDVTPSGSVMMRVLGASATDVGGLAPSGVFVNVADALGAVDGSVAGGFSSAGGVIETLDLVGRNLAIGSTGAATGAIAQSLRRVAPITGEMGDTSSTALAAVDTGALTLGANQTRRVAEATGATSTVASIEQLGGSAAARAMIANLALSANAVFGGIVVRARDANLSAGSPFTFTTLGSVNTGRIVSGVSASLDRTVAAIVTLR